MYTSNIEVPHSVAIFSRILTIEKTSFYLTCNLRNWPMTF